MCTCVCVCVHACVRVCVRACVCVCVQSSVFAANGGLIHDFFFSTEHEFVIHS